MHKVTKAAVAAVSALALTLGPAAGAFADSGSPSPPGGGSAAPTLCSTAEFADAAKGLPKEQRDAVRKVVRDFRDSCRAAEKATKDEIKELRDVMRAELAVYRQAISAAATALKAAQASGDEAAIAAAKAALAKAKQDYKEAKAALEAEFAAAAEELMTNLKVEVEAFRALAWALIAEIRAGVPGTAMAA